MMVSLLLGLALAAPNGGARAEEEVEGPDRSVPPEVLPSSPLEHPEPTRVALSPGLELWHVPVPTTRKVAVFVQIGQGRVELEANALAVDLMRGAMGDSTENYKAEELSISKDLAEIELWSSASRQASTLRMVVPKTDLAKGMELLDEVLNRPKYAKKDVQRHQRDADVWLKQQGPASQSAVASSALSYSWIPKSHAFEGRPDLEKLESKWKEFRDLQVQWRAAPYTVIVVGDLTADEAKAAVQGKFPHAVAGSRPAPKPFAAPTGNRVVAVDMPGQSQTALRLRMSAPKFADADRASFEALSFVVGGHFLSRLNANLREDKGFTYGSRARFSPGDSMGTFSVSVDVKAENTADAIEEIEGELAALVAPLPLEEEDEAKKKGKRTMPEEPTEEGEEPEEVVEPRPITEDELSMYTRTAIANWNDTFATSQNAVWLYESLYDHRQTAEAARAELLAASELTAEGLHAVAEEWLHADAARYWVIVGDREQIEPQLQRLGLSPEWVDPQQAIFGDL